MADGQDADAADNQVEPPDPAPPPVAPISPAPKTGTIQETSREVHTSYYDLLRSVVEAPGLNGEQKQMLLDKLRKSSPTSDRLTYRLAISILGIVVVSTIAAIWHLLDRQTPANIPDGLIAIASAAVGGLAGLLSPGRNGANDPGT